MFRSFSRGSFSSFARSLSWLVLSTCLFQLCTSYFSVASVGRKQIDRRQKKKKKPPQNDDTDVFLEFMEFVVVGLRSLSELFRKRGTCPDSIGERVQFDCREG